MIWATFSLSFASGINTGIITSLFSTSLIFTSAYFYFKFGQKLSLLCMVGILLVVACVVLVSLSGEE
jgi:uncharacterized membrane protein